MVYCGVYPADSARYQDLRDALEKLQLNDASLQFEPETSAALGFGFRCGFLGLLHMEIVQERLRREFNLDIISTTPGVVYKLKMKDGAEKDLDNPIQMPDVTLLESISEPILKARIITPSESIGDVMRIVMDRRGLVEGTETVDGHRVMLHCMLPLNEILIDFHDTLKSVSHGYASMDYEPAGYQESDIVKMDILLNSEVVDAFATLVHRSKARARGQQMCKALADTIPPHMFKIPVQAAIGKEIIAREDIRPFRKDVLAKLYGGDVTRKMKVLEKQKRGKARMKEFGHVNVPQSAFIAVLKGTVKET
jgi:GTP-binding protein LepA